MPQSLVSNSAILSVKAVAAKEGSLSVLKAIVEGRDCRRYRGS